MLSNGGQRCAWLSTLHFNWKVSNSPNKTETLTYSFITAIKTRLECTTGAMTTATRTIQIVPKKCAPVNLILKNNQRKMYQNNKVIAMLDTILCTMCTAHSVSVYQSVLWCLQNGLQKSSAKRLLFFHYF